MTRGDGLGELYDLLGVPSDADPPRIRRVYRELARAVRLDVSQGPENGDRIRELTHAFEVLSNPRSRLVYDRLAFGDGNATDEWAETDDEELIVWVFGTERSNEASRKRSIFPTGDLLVRWLAVVGFVIALLLLLVVLARG
jgi:curved DNA-binding protein CbpA